MLVKLASQVEAEAKTEMAGGHDMDLAKKAELRERQLT